MIAMCGQWGLEGGFVEAGVLETGPDTEVDW